MKKLINIIKKVIGSLAFIPMEVGESIEETNIRSRDTKIETLLSE